MGQEHISILISLATAILVVVGAIWGVVNWRKMDLEHLRQRLTDSEADRKKCREDIDDLEKRYQYEVDNLQRGAFAQGLRADEMERHAKRLGVQCLDQQRHIHILEWQQQRLLTALEQQNIKVPDLDAHEY